MFVALQVLALVEIQLAGRGRELDGAAVSEYLTTRCKVPAADQVTSEPRDMPAMPAPQLLLGLPPPIQQPLCLAAGLALRDFAPLLPSRGTKVMTQPCPIHPRVISLKPPPQGGLLKDAKRLLKFIQVGQRLRMLRPPGPLITLKTIAACCRCSLDRLHHSCHATVQDMFIAPLHQHHASLTLASRAYGPQPS